MADIFLSYNEKDREVAHRVAAMLGAGGWTVWWDRRIPAGETWRSVLEDALENMRCMVVVWSKRSVESEWVYEEASEGRRRGKLVPVMIEPVRPPAGFREIQAQISPDGMAQASLRGCACSLPTSNGSLANPTQPQRAKFRKQRKVKSGALARRKIEVALMTKPIVAGTWHCQRGRSRRGCRCGW